MKTVHKPLYETWSVFDPKHGQVFYVINILTKKVHSSWSDLKTARIIVADLNAAEQARNDRAINEQAKG